MTWNIFDCCRILNQSVFKQITFMFGERTNGMKRCKKPSIISKKRHIDIRSIGVKPKYLVVSNSRLLGEN
jgi:hypothetical protein